MFYVWVILAGQILTLLNVALLFYKIQIERRNTRTQSNSIQTKMTMMIIIFFYFTSCSGIRFVFICLLSKVIVCLKINVYFAGHYGLQWAAASARWCWTEHLKKTNLVYRHLLFMIKIESKRFRNISYLKEWE